MVNTLSGSVCAYRKETVKPRFIRIDEVMALSLPNSNSVYMATNLKEDKVVMGFSIALIIIVLIVLYSLARTAGESDRTMEQIREQSLLGREESSGGNS